MKKQNNKKRKNTFFINIKRIYSSYKFNFLELLAIKTDFFYNLLMKWRTPVFIKEIKMAKINSKDQVLHIGSGILPSAPIIIAEKTNADITSIDNNRIIVRLAKKFIEKRGLSDRIKIKYGDGKKFNAEDFNLIVIAINVWPVELILKNLACKTKKNTKIILRCEKDEYDDLFSNKKITDSFSFEKKSSNLQTQSFLIIKK